MVQAADFWELNDLARRGGLDEPEVGCVLVEREVRARLMVVSEVVGQDSAQVSFAEHENVVQALAPDRTDQALREGFCQGLCGAVRTSSMRMPLTRWRNCSPYTWSRSRRR